MKIGFIGKGRVAQALAERLAARHEIRFGVREPAAPNHAAVVAVAQWAEVVILTTPWRAVAEVAAEIAPHVSGKPVLDATNPVAMAAHGPTVAAEAAPSVAEGLQRALPKAHVVKTFNQIGAEYLAHPGRLDPPPVMFAAGDAAAAKDIALSLITEVGFDAMDAGPLANARHLESFAMLWIWQAAKGPLGRSFGFARSRALS